MKALSIRQPWAWAILHGKPVENRPRRTSHRGPLLIHASKTFDRDGYYWLSKHRYLLTAELPHRDQFEMGGIVGITNLVDCVDRHPSPFFFGPRGYVLENSEPTTFIQIGGQLGIFNVPLEVVEKPKCVGLSTCGWCRPECQAHSDFNKKILRFTK